MTEARRPTPSRSSTGSADLSQDHLAVAVWLYLRRHYRIDHPAGGFDLAGHWYPSDKELQPCCQKPPKPTRANPYSILVHCLSAEHVAQPFGIDDAATVIYRARELESASIQELVRLHRAALVRMTVLQILDFARMHSLDLSNSDTLRFYFWALEEHAISTRALREHYEQPELEDDLDAERERPHSQSTRR